MSSNPGYQEQINFYSCLLEKRFIPDLKRQPYKIGNCRGLVENGKKQLEEIKNVAGRGSNSKEALAEAKEYYNLFYYPYVDCKSVYYSSLLNSQWQNVSTLISSGSYTGSKLAALKVIRGIIASSRSQINQARTVSAQMKAYSDFFDNFNRVKAFFDASEPGKYDEGMIFFEAGEYEEAKASFGAALKENPDDYNSAMQYAEVLIKQGRYDQSVPYFQRARAALEKANRPDLVQSVSAKISRVESTIEESKRVYNLKEAKRSVNAAIIENFSVIGYRITGKIVLTFSCRKSQDRVTLKKTDFSKAGTISMPDKKNKGRYRIISSDFLKNRIARMAFFLERKAAQNGNFTIVIENFSAEK